MTRRRPTSVATLVLMAMPFAWAEPWSAQAVSAAPGEDSFPSRQCDTPANLTGTMTLVGNAAQPIQPAIVWDGAAFGVAYSSVVPVGVRFMRVAADGTVLIPATTVGPSGFYGSSLVWTGSEYGLAFENLPSTEILFARISTAGSRIGSEVQLSTTQGALSYAPSIAWTGSQYGVAWQDFRDGNYEIYFRRADASGVALGATDARITNDAATSHSPNASFNGTDYAVVWDDARTTASDIYGARVSTSTGLKVGADVQITSDAGQSHNPFLAWNGSGFGVAWSDSRTTTADIYFANLTPLLAKVGADVQITSTAGLSVFPTLSWTGSEYGVAYQDERDGNPEIYYSRVSPAGPKIGGDLRLTSDVAASQGYAGGLAFGTLGFGSVHYTSTSGVQEIRFVGLGCHADTTPPSCPNGLTVTGNSGSGVTLTWVQPGIDGETELAYHRVYRDGLPIGVTTGRTYTEAPRPAGTVQYTVVAVNALGLESTGCAVVTAPEPTGACGEDWTGSQVVTLSTNLAQAPRAAWTGSAYGIAWWDRRDGNDEIYFRRVAADGVLLGPDVRVTQDPAGSYDASLVWNGTSYGLAFNDARPGNYEIYFNRLSPEGVPQIPGDSRITIAAGSSSAPSLVWTGSEYGVAWHDVRDGNFEIYFNRISAGGFAVGPDLRVTSDPGISVLPSLVWTGQEYGLAWQDDRAGNNEIYFNRISSTGTIAGPDLRVTTSSAPSVNPSLAWSGAEYGLAWNDLRDGNNEIYVNRISASGSILVPGDRRVTTDPGSSSAPRLVFPGSEYHVAWTDDRTGSGDIYGATLDVAGYKVGPDRRLSAAPTSDEASTVAVGGRGLGLAYDVAGPSGQVRFVGLGCGSLDTTPPSCPASPAEIGRTPGNPGTLTLGWAPAIEPDSDLAEYRITRDGSPIGVTDFTTFTDATFDPSAGSVYVVSAVNAAGLVSPACGSVTTADTLAPTCPSNLLATVQPSPLQVTITWLPSQDALSGLRRYQVHRDNALQGYVPAGTTSFVDATIANGTTYNYAVLAEDWAGNVSSACGSTSVVWISTSPITLFVAKDGNGIDADLDWNDAGLHEYVVYRSTSPQTSSELKRVPLSETPDPVLNDGVAIWYYHIQQRGM